MCRFRQFLSTLLDLSEFVGVMVLTTVPIPYYRTCGRIDYPNISIKLAFIRSSSQLPFVDNLKRGIA